MWARALVCAVWWVCTYIRNVKVVLIEGDTGFHDSSASTVDDTEGHEREREKKRKIIRNSLLTANSSHQTENHLMLFRVLPSGKVNVMSFLRYRFNTLALP